MPAMEQLLQIGEAIGSLRAIMVFREDIQINHRQCCLLFDAFNLAFDVVSKEIKQYLKFDEKLTKWRALEIPLKELHKVIKDGESYIKLCLDPKDWWAKAITLPLNTDCVELHIHNLLWCLPVVLEAIENAGEISGSDQDAIVRKRFVFFNQYEREMMDPKLFFLQFASHYLVSPEMCHAFDSVWKEDRWILTETIEKMIVENKTPMPSIRYGGQLAEIMIAERDKVHPSGILVGSKDFQWKSRLGGRGHYKEVQWMGESFALRHCYHDFDCIASEISLLTSLMHPNVLNYMYVFSDAERKEFFVLTELMSKDLRACIREITSVRRRVQFPLLVAVDIMIQISRGMEYLHSRKVYHGELNPSNILVKSRSSSSDSYFNVKITGLFGRSIVKKSKPPPHSAKQSEKHPEIWYAPEVLAEVTPSRSSSLKPSEKADVYSFSMICFELLTGKVPSEDDHLRGDKLSRSIRSGERPLFTAASPKYITNLIRKCWHQDPSARPSFSSTSRVLRYIKRFLVMNPEHSHQLMLSPPVDYFDIEMRLLKKFPAWSTEEAMKVSEIPFQMFCYRVLEREKTNTDQTESSSDSGRDEAQIAGLTRSS